VTGRIYSETVVWSPPPDLAALAPYQLVLVDLENGARVTGRMAGDRRARIGDPVAVHSHQDGLYLFDAMPR
jgi:uncharacterized OB-fold protein